ncbi:LysR family transcriptional regulator [Niallia circulans]|uniref:LysR family transcriptional regulator n=1 Tax=Niallia circulans TaxID=1397 RepID=A0A553SRP4_NIACI|nr:LysR family transcriptional regulator [Niallia circulans]TRZ39669.1 LysR family transcriptional regulator [Niallia circulans]
MESHELKIFKHVAELQSVSKAAEKLGYVQPNVSQRIKNLENELGVRLFMRNNRGVTLTEEGKKLLDYTNEILQLIDEAKTAVNPNKWREPLKIGASQTISAVKIPHLLSSFLKEYNNIDVKVRTNNNLTLEKMLFYGEVDGIFVNSSKNITNCDVIYSYFEKIVLITPKLNPFDINSNHTLIVNSDVNCIYRKQLLELSKESNFHSSNIIEFESLESIIQAVHDGLGISIIPADIAANRKSTKEIIFTELPKKIQVDFLIKNKKQQTPGLKKFIRFLQINNNKK